MYAYNEWSSSRMSYTNISNQNKPEGRKRRTQRMLLRRLLPLLPPLIRIFVAAPPLQRLAVAHVQHTNRTNRKYK